MTRTPSQKKDGPAATKVTPPVSKKKTASAKGDSSPSNIASQASSSLPVKRKIDFSSLGINIKTENNQRSNDKGSKLKVGIVTGQGMYPN